MTANATSAEALVGVDIGGTFTDIVLVRPDGQVDVVKVRSTTDDYSVAIRDGIGELLARLDLPPETISQLNHGTTVATNAVLEGKGARTALLTTEGFRDVLEIGRIQAARLYDLQYDKPPPLVQRQWRLEVRERVDGQGDVLVELDEQHATELLDKLSEAGIEALAVCLINSYVNPVHELALGRLIEQHHGEFDVTLSHQLLQEIGEYERTSTAVVNSYVMPIVGNYLLNLDANLRGLGFAGTFSVMGSGGGLMEVGPARQKPALMIESGPAAGVIAAKALADSVGYGDLITFDMGGTTAKASTIENGAISYSPQLEVGGDMSFGNELLGAGGYPVRSNVIKLTEVGAGGGSCVWFDEAGGMHVGPESAGSVPGPICYARGGEEVTVTDANVVLGYVNERSIAGGTVDIDAGLARRAMEEKVAARLREPIESAAHGVYLIAAANMIRAIKAVSVERGRNPRNFDLLAFGGNGPLFGAEIASAMGMRRVIVPQWAGVFSVVGLLGADATHHHALSIREPLSELPSSSLRSIIAAARANVREFLQQHEKQAIATDITLSLRYVGQRFELEIPIHAEDDALEAITTDGIVAAFHAEHERTYGHHALDSEVELAGVRVVTVQRRGLPFDAMRRKLSASAGAAPADEEIRKAYFGREIGYLQTTVLLDRSLLDPDGTRGPCVVEELDSTTLIPPDWTARLDAAGNIIMARVGGDDQ
ncbi:hydantoinase/oxoprolinase family protein [Actinophytocola sp.]|uniref:hydantoinase/oxoprolinase family protein n=1 Tax=Actinophytocola sp. TaxID=1872138 RepID=UPI003D6B9C2D